MAGVDSGCTVRHSHMSTTGGEHSTGVPANASNGEEKKGNIEKPHPQPEKMARALVDLLARERELETARIADLKADRCHIEELKAFVSEFVLKGCSRPQQATVAEVLVQVSDKTPDVACRCDRHDIIQLNFVASNSGIRAGLK